MRTLAPVIALSLCACSFKPGLVGGDGGGGGDDTDGSNGNPNTVANTIVEDTAGELTGTVTGGVLDPLGLIEPHTYATRGLHTVGFKKSGITKDTDLTKLPDLGPSSGEEYGFAPTGTWPQNPQTGSGQNPFPFGFALAKSDDWSLVFDGEIFLDAGDTVLHLDVDDAAVIEIDVPGGAVTMRADTGGNNGAQTFHADTAGWYPIKGAFSENKVDARFHILAADNSEYPTTRYRALTTTTPGLVQAAFFESEEEVPMGPLYTNAPVDGHIILGDYPFNTLFSIRYQGQFRVDTAGDHTLSVSVGGDADDHFRLFVDNQLVGAHWLTMTDLTPGAQTLAAGWHSIVLDYGQNTGNAEVHLAIDGAIIPADHLRPTHTRSQSFAVPSPFQACPVTTAPTDCAMVPVFAADGAVIDYADVQYFVKGSTRAFDTSTMVAGAKSFTLPIHATANETEFGAGSGAYDYDAFHTDLAGEPASGTWKLTVSAPAATGGSTIFASALVTSHGGEDAPFEETFSYDSQAYPVADGAVLTGGTVSGDFGGATTTLFYRTGADNIQLAAAPYSPIAAGGNEDAPLGKLVQFRATVAGDGWSFATIDKIELDYTTPAP